MDLGQLATCMWRCHSLQKGKRKSEDARINVGKSRMCRMRGTPNLEYMIGRHLTLARIGGSGPAVNSDAPLVPLLTRKRIAL